MSEPIRISDDELRDPRVDEALAQEAAIHGAWSDDAEGGEEVGSLSRAKRSRAASDEGRGIYAWRVVAMALLGLAGGGLGWAVCEPFIVVGPQGGAAVFVMLLLVVTGATTFIAVGDGVLSQAWVRAAWHGLVGLGLGSVGALVATVVGGILYMIGQLTVVSAVDAFAPAALAQLRRNPDDLPFVILVGNMSARAAAWTVLGVTAGVTPGIVQRSRDLLMVGILGGVVGGFLGGLFFDPIAEAFGSAAVSRGVGFAVVGLMAGLAIGIVEQLSKDAWLYMVEGPLAGKQFVIYKDPTRIGSSPKCDVYIFKDPEVEPEHALLRRGGSAHEVEAVGAGSVQVNGQRVRRQRLEDGDEVKVGRARFRYYVRENKRTVR